MHNSPGIRNETVMVVDDTPENLMLLEYMLQESGYRVLTFPRGDLALKAAERNPPDLVLLDIDMPGLDGYQVCDRLKANPRLKHIPVLFLSAFSETSDKVKAFSAGGQDYVTKPFQPEEVLTRVNTHLQLSHLREELEAHNAQLEEMVQQKVSQLVDSHIATIFALAKLTESRDDDTGMHIERTRLFCRKIAEQLAMDKSGDPPITSSFIDTLYYTAPLHDVGKVGIADSILLKPGRLSPEEFKIMQTHPAIGAKTLGAVSAMYSGNAYINMGIEIAHCHHERWDGSGYPRNLRGTEIPLSARIMALADVYDALRSRRVYKPPLSHQEACVLIRQGEGSHFDPAVVAAFFRIHDNLDRLFGTMQDPAG